MKKNWLREMLTPAKGESEIWQGFADVLQSMLNTEVDPTIERIDSRKSVFSMSSEDLDKRVNELGQFFSIRSKNEKTKPILLVQRQDEIHFKGTERPITATFWREFENLPARWEPLWAPIDQTKAPYGSFFTVGSSVQFSSQTYGDFFMTSRGKIALSINALHAQFGAGKQADLMKRVQSQFDELIRPLLPLDIVFDGFLVYMDYTFTERKPDFYLTRIEKVNYNFGVGFEEWRWKLDHWNLKVSYPPIPMSQITRPTSYLPYRYDETPIDLWWADAQARPSIIPINKSNPGNTIPDPRLTIGANQITVVTMGAAQVGIEFKGGGVQYYDTNGAASITIPMLSATIDLIQSIFYSVN